MSLSSEALLRMRPGRKRRPEMQRSPDGRSNGERPADIVSVARAYRVKFGASEETALYAEHGSTIGKLQLEKVLTLKQADIACSYHQCVISHARLLGIPSPHPRASDLVNPFKGQSCAPESDTAEINRIKGLFRDCRRALLDCGRDLLVGSNVNRVVYGVVVENWPLWILRDGDVQNLRCGLNALGRILK